MIRNPHINRMEMPKHFSLTDLDLRARNVFRDIVETFLSTGQPVGLARLHWNLASRFRLRPSAIPCQT